MSYDFTILMEFISSLALVAMLALGYGALRRRFPAPNRAQVLLGLVFGGVTIIQMHLPLSPTEGVIIDMRNVPIVLAGAFLGFRGLAVCLLMAIVTRYGIGGIGVVPGVLGMIASGAVGLLWDRYTSQYQKRSPAMLITLGVVMNVHLLFALVFPADLALWFFTVAAPVIIVLNIVSVPIVGALLERERSMLRQEARLVDSAIADPATGLLTQSAFAREVSHAAAANPSSPIRAILVVRLRNRRWLQSHLGPDAMAQMTGGLRHRVRDVLSQSGFFGGTVDGHILAPITEQQLFTLSEIDVTLNRAMRDNHIALPDGRATRLTLDCELVPIENALDVRSVLASIKQLQSVKAAARSDGANRARNTSAASTGLHAALFAKTENLRLALHG